LGRVAGCLVWRRACGPGACGGVAARVVCGLSDGDGDQRGAGAGDGSVGGDSDYVCDSVSGGVFDFCGDYYPGEFDCGDAVPADSGGGGAEDAGSDAAADCDGVFYRICGVGVGGWGCGGVVCEYHCAGAAEAVDGGVSLSVDVDG